MSILCIYNGRVVPNAASCRLALDCASCTIVPYVMSAHPRTSKYLPYVSKYTTKTDPANLHFKNLCAWGDDRTVAGWKYAIQNHYDWCDNRQVKGYQLHCQQLILPTKNHMWLGLSGIKI